MKPKSQVQLPPVLFIDLFTSTTGKVKRYAVIDAQAKYEYNRTNLI